LRLWLIRPTRFAHLPGTSPSKTTDRDPLSIDRVSIGGPRAPNGHVNRRRPPNFWAVEWMRSMGASAHLLRDAVHAPNDVGVHCSNEGGRKVKTAIITLSATRSHRRRSGRACPECVKRSTAPAPSSLEEAQVFQLRSVACDARQQREDGLSRASGYAPSSPKDYTYDNSRNGGGGGGGSGM
jgi:hypothetical protein